MVLSNKNKSRTYFVFSWLVFGLLLTYLLLRAYFLEPLHDEVATFFHYIESGVFWGPDVQLDANNHILNSILSHWLYLVFGDQFFYLRLPNVLAFILYFWGIYRFIKPIQFIIGKALILLGTTCIPFILEYFAYTRGYGISMGLFMFSLSYIRDFAKTRNVKSVYWSALLLGLAVYANLTLLLSLILMGLFFLLIQFIYRNDINKKGHVFLFIAYFLLGLAMLPNLMYAQLLKDSGALYYGGLEGFWEVTGKSLARNIIFHELNWLKYASIVVVLLLMSYFIHRWMKIKNLQFFTKSSTVLAWFLFGNCAAVVLMAKLLGINYPADRVGMHLPVLFILLLGFVLSQFKYSKWLLLGLLFFPLTMIPRINVSTSVFSPDDRTSHSFFEEVNKHINPYSAISIYPMQMLTWAFLSRDFDSTNYLVSEREFNHASDVVIHRTTLIHGHDYLKNYNVIAHHPESTHIAYQRKSPHQKNIIFELPLNIIDASHEYITFYNFIQRFIAVNYSL